MIARYKAAHEAEDLGVAARLASMITSELSVHMAIEEEIFYPAVRGISEPLTAMIDEGVEEHHVAKMLIREAQELDPADDEWVAKIKVLIESVEHHVDEEESDMFPKIRAGASSADLKALGEKLDARKAELGAATVADKMGLSKTELSELARAQQIPGRSSMDHDELAATVGIE